MREDNERTRHPDHPLSIAARANDNYEDQLVNAHTKENGEEVMDPLLRRQVSFEEKEGTTTEQNQSEKKRKVWMGALHRRVAKQAAELRVRGKIAAAEELESQLPDNQLQQLEQDPKAVTPPLKLPVISQPQGNQSQTDRSTGYCPPSETKGIKSDGSSGIVLRNSIDHDLLVESSSRNVEQLIDQMTQPQRLMAGVHSIRGLQHQPLYPVQASGFPAVPRLLRDVNHGKMSMNRTVYEPLKAFYRTI